MFVLYFFHPVWKAKKKKKNLIKVLSSTHDSFHESFLHIQYVWLFLNFLLFSFNVLAHFNLESCRNYSTTSLGHFKLMCSDPVFPVLSSL